MFQGILAKIVKVGGAAAVGGAEEGNSVICNLGKSD